MPRQSVFGTASPRNRAPAHAPRRSAFACVLALTLLAATSSPTFAAEPLAKPVPVSVEFYRIAVELFPEKQELAATTRVGLRAAAHEVRTIAFQLASTLEIESIKDDGGETLKAERLGPRYSHSYLLDLRQPLAAGDRAELEFHYAGRMAEKPLDYVTSRGVLLRDEARWYPIFDLSAIAGLEMHITVPRAWEAVTSGELVERAAAGNKTTFAWRTARPVPSRSLAAGPLAVFTLRLDGTDFYIYLSRPDEALASSLAHRLSDILRFYGERFGAYPWPRYSVIEGLPQPAGKTGYSAPGFLVASISALRNQRYLQHDPQFLPHEVAHQWFPGEVTMASETDAFIAESLAEYCALLYLERLLPADDLHAFVRRTYLAALAGDLIPLAPGLRLFGWYDWSTVYRTLYERGLLVYRTLHTLLGDDAFLQLLREFYSRYRGRAASVDDFRKLAEEIHGAPLAWFFDYYLKGTDLPEMNLRFEKTEQQTTGHLRVASVPAEFVLPVELEFREAEPRGQAGRHPVARLLLSARSGDNVFESPQSARDFEAVIDPGWKILFWREEARRNRAIVRLLGRAAAASANAHFRVAEQAFKRALAGDPSDLVRQRMWVTFTLGRLYFRQHRYALTLDTMSRALKLESYDPSLTQMVHAWAHVFRGYALERTGRRSRALAEYRAAREAAEPPALESPFALEEFDRITSADREIAEREAHPLPRLRAK